MPKKTRFKIKFPFFLLTIFIIAFATFLGVDYFRNNLFHRSDVSNYKSTDNGLGILGASEIGNLNTEVKPNLADNNFTSALIVGMDTRDGEVKNGVLFNEPPPGVNGSRNADTIMQAVFDHRTNNIFLISMPRDIGVDVREDCLHYAGPIYAVYDKAQKKNCPGGGVEVLKKTVTGITGIPIQYHVFITLDLFQEIIKTVGQKDSNGNVGIIVDNPKGFSDLYPSSTHTGYDSVYFPKGQLFLTPYRALQFARTRQWTSDWDRDHRQQLVVEAVAKSVLSTDTWLNPEKIYSMYQAYKDKVVASTPKDIFEIISLMDLARKVDTKNIYNLVLGPEFGGHEVYLNKQPHDRPGPYYMVPTAWKSCPGNEYCKVQEYIRQIIDDPGLLVDSSY